MPNFVQASLASPNVLERTQTSVQVRRSWGDPWQTLPYLEISEVDTHAGPGIDRATFLYRYGTNFWQESGSFTRYLPGDLDGWFIRGVCHTAGRTFMPFPAGVVVDQAYDLMGATANGVTGDQLIVGMGIEYLLTKIPILGAYVTAGELAGDSEATYIKSCPVFNQKMKHEDYLVGNRSAEVGADDVYLFSKTEGTLWTNLDILNYLLFYYAPTELPIKLSGQYAILDGITARHKFEGQTTKQAIDALVDRHRGLGWCFRYTDSSIYLHIYTSFGHTLRPLPDTDPEMIFPGNAEQVNLDISSQVDIDKAIVRIQGNTQYDQIVVMGGRIETCFSLGVTIDPENPEFKKGWSSDIETAYKDALEVADATDETQCDEARRADKFEAVFQRYVLEDGWKGFALDYGNVGVAGLYPLALVRWVDGEIEITDEDPPPAAPCYLADKTFIRHLPIKKAGAVVGLGSEYMEPMVFVWEPGQTVLLPEEVANFPHRFYKYIQLDLGGDTDEKPGASIRMIDDAPGALVKSKVPHIFADEPLAPYSSAFPSKYEPVYNPLFLIFTVCLATDERISIMRKVRESENPRTLFIEAPHSKVQYITPGTVIGLREPTIIYPDTGTKGTNLKRHEGGIVRNDADRLKVAAALAEAWYGEPRNSISVTIKNAVKMAEIGMYVTHIGSGWHRQQVGTVVTSQSWRFEKDRVTTQIETSWYELDVSRVLEFPGIGSSVSPKALARHINYLQRDIQELKRDNTNKVDRHVRVYAGSGAGGDGALVPHSHSGMWDGGYANFLSAGR